MPLVARSASTTDEFTRILRASTWPHLDELAYDFFGTETMRDAIRRKVTALFPAHEIDEFTELFWQRIQRWREPRGARR